MDLRNISDLSSEDRENCLFETHEHFRKHPALQMRGRGSGFVLLGKGPALDSDCDDDRFVYNGSDRGGGRVFSGTARLRSRTACGSRVGRRVAAELVLLCTRR